MKKSFLAVFITLACVLSITVGVTFLVNRLSNKPEKTFSQTSNLTSLVTEDMPLNEIAQLYVDSCVTVYVPGASLGSGVCVAANGYQTDSGYVAQKGAYIATNYHVISSVVDSDFTEDNFGATIILNGQSYQDKQKADVVWYDKDVDMALLYCDEDLTAINDDFGYITLKDRVVACQASERLSFDSIFTIGTPLNISYQNTFAKGYVSNLNLQDSFTMRKLYIQFGGRYTKNSKYASSAYSTIDVVDNVYQKLIMMNLDITSGNSGGGVFDENGYLIGLSTLSIGTEDANTASMNFAVPVYPLTLILDKIIRYNEGENATNDVMTLDSIGIYGLDGDEITYVKQVGSSYGLVNNGYYIDGHVFNVTTYEKAFRFSGMGYVVLSVNTNLQAKNLQKDFVITRVDDKIVSDKNDLIYVLYSHNRGQIMKVTGYSLDTPTLMRDYNIVL